VEAQAFYDSTSGFPSNVFINVFKINNELVFTGERGIYSYSKSRDAFVPHDVLNAVIGKNSHTRKLIEDREGNVWFASGDELGVLKKHNGQHYEVIKTIFNKLQRRLVGGFEHIAFYDERNVIIGTDDGFVHFDPSFVFNTDHTFTTLIRRVEVTTEKDSLLSGGWFGVTAADATTQPAGRVPVLPHRYNALRFTFSATSFEDAPQVQYQYMLQGYDAGWSAWGPLTHKEYTNLKEGDYIFFVKSKDIYNREGSVAAYSFRVLPPWYRTLWAYCAYVALFIILLAAVYRLARHEQRKALRMREIEHQEDVLKAEKEIIKLNNEKLESELLHKSKELASSAMHIVHSVETIEKIKASLLAAIDVVHDPDARNQMRRVLRSIDNEATMDNRWEQFELHFNQLHDDFLVRLRKEYPNLTHNDIKLISYLKLNLSSKEIAPLLNLSVRGVEASRYRIRKKMNLRPQVNLTDFILKY
jgi:DNA-binding CsgD family transcriptional regulator